MRVKVLAPVVRYGENGFKYKGDEYSLPEEKANAMAAKKLVKIIGETKAEVEAAKKEEK